MVSGATSYDILRSTRRDSGFTPIATGHASQVCGSGASRATFADTTAVNGTQYFYAVKSVNPGGRSAESPVSAGAKPESGLAASAPSVPENMKITGSGHHQVALSWGAAPVVF